MCALGKPFSTPVEDVFSIQVRTCLCTDVRAMLALFHALFTLALFVA